ncbi:nucleotidyltransferase family protein [Sulfurisoma sediminicola]|nr:nucleotidyltransferase domain-containing protein [Sulfurisoma sediminicola]
MLPVTDQRSIASLLRPLLRQASAELILFGSGAGGDARLASDVDIAVRAAQPLPPDLLAAARQSLEDSNVPFNVDLLDYATLSDELKQAIDREGIAWPV